MGNNNQNTENIIYVPNDDSRQLLAPCLLKADDPAYKSVEELDYAVSQHECKNIALTGVFGSGKSSVINTFLQLKKTTKKVLRISLSNFEDIVSLEQTDNNKPSDGNELSENDKYYEDGIEYKVFQHILYKADPDKTGNTRFTRLHAINKDKIKKKCECVCLFFLCFIVVFEPKVLQIDSFYKAYDYIFGRISNITNIICDIIASLVMVKLLYEFSVKVVCYLSCISIHRIKAKDIEVELNKDKPVFNKLLDEILYFFEAGEYEIIVFEDLDRINKPSWLFLKLREINLLLNESDDFIANDKHITFIYAIKDDIFQDEVRTKCFDYIVPIIPVVDSFNAGEYLLKNYKAALSGINDVDVKRLGLFMTRIRELINIMNEYQLYKKTIFKEVMSSKKLLAMTIYKNLYPDDYSKIHSKDGFLYYVFSHKSVFTKPLTSQKSNTIKNLDSELNNAKEGIYNYRMEILNVLNDKRISKVEIKGVIYSLNDVARKDVLYNSFENDKIDKWYIEDPDSPGMGIYSYKYNELIKNFNSEGYYDHILNEIRQLEWTISDYQNTKDKLEKEIRIIENRSLKDLMVLTGGYESLKLIIYDYYSYQGDINHLEELQKEENDIQDAVIKKVNEPIVNTVYGLIRNGYISEDYETYISYTYTGSYGEQEFNFQQSVLQGLELPFDYKLNHIESVIDTLYSDYYGSRSILNFDLLNYLLKSSNNAQIDNFIETARKNIDFIQRYDLQSGKKSEFFDRLFKDWIGCVSLISSIQDNDQRSFMLKLLYRIAPLTIRVSTEEREFLNTQYACICENFSLLNVEHLVKFIRNCEIIFSQLVEPTEQTKAIFDMVVGLHAFDITYDNLRIIYGEDFEVRPLTMIICSNENLSSYLLRDINYLLNLLPESATNENEKALILLSMHSSIDDKDLYVYFIRQKNKIALLSSAKPERYKICIESDIVVPTWTNVSEFISKGNDISEIAAYINKHGQELAKEKLGKDDEELQKLVLNSDSILSIDVYKILAPTAQCCVDVEDIPNLEDERVKILLDNELIEYSVNATKFISQYSPHLISQYFIQYFDKIMEEDRNIQYNNSNAVGIDIMESDLSIDKKRSFLAEFGAIFKDSDDKGIYARMICEFYRTNGFSDGMDLDLLVRALEEYNEADAWFTKIDLINKVHRIYDHDAPITERMVRSLGVPYNQLIEYSYSTILDKNEQNNELVKYLKDNEPYISKIIPLHDEGKFKVTYKKNQEN
jgi:hypothetical protein